MINKYTLFAYGSKARNCSNFGWNEAPAWYIFDYKNFGKCELTANVLEFLQSVTTKQWVLIPKELKGKDENFVNYIRALPISEWKDEEENWKKGIIF